MNITKQELFDKAVGKIIEQGELGLAKGGGCTYFSDEGKKCVVGCLVDDDTLRKVASQQAEYLTKGIDDIMDPRTQDNIIRGYLVDTYGITSDDVEFLSDLQTRHDMAATFNGFLISARSYAIEQELDHSIIKL